jgi:hypothetical protein
MGFFRAADVLRVTTKSGERGEGGVPFLNRFVSNQVLINVRKAPKGFFRGGRVDQTVGVLVVITPGEAEG